MSKSTEYQGGEVCMIDDIRCAAHFASATACCGYTGPVSTEDQCPAALPHCIDYKPRQRGRCVRIPWPTAHRLLPYRVNGSMSSCRSHAWLFVLSTGRSGSTTILNMLNAIPQIKLSGENGNLLPMLNNALEHSIHWQALRTTPHLWKRVAQRGPS